MDLLAKLATTAERHARMKFLGGDAVGVVNEKLISPTRALIDGRETILAGTNNYMGITFDAECIAAGQKALAEFGTGTTGSRIANGSFALHKQLETEFATFLDRKHCIVFTTGYQANLGMMSGLAGSRDTIYLDADSHSSIYDGCTLSGAKLVRFRHNDAADLDKRLARLADKPGNKLIVIEGIYSMLGDKAPLADIVAVKKKYENVYLLSDEAHSLGVLGKYGRGLPEEVGCEDDVDFIVGTFSKSVGTVGGFCVSNHPQFDILRLMTRAYVFTASLPPSVVASATVNLGLVKNGGALRKRLMRNAQKLHAGLTAIGLKIASENSPVVAVVAPDPMVAVAFWRGLIEAGVYVNLALPPATPYGYSLLRASLCAAHTEEQLDEVIAIFAQVAAKVGLASSPEKQVAERKRIAVG